MRVPRLKKEFLTALLVLSGMDAVQAQAVVTFNYPWMNNGLGYFGLGYYDGFAFRVVPPTPPPTQIDAVRHVGAIGPAGYPHNGTPFVAFINTLGTPQYVMFIRTNLTVGQPVPPSFTAGDPFGLISVDLADPVAPSLAPIDITFNGFRADGSMVSQTFTVGGGGSSSFQRVYFGPAFAHGLVRVEIPSPAWAMDNIVWIPEPDSAALLGLGLLAWAARRFPRPDRS
jgi:hypothetical protein